MAARSVGLVALVMGKLREIKPAPLLSEAEVAAVQEMAAQLVLLAESGGFIAFSVQATGPRTWHTDEVNIGSNFYEHVGLVQCHATTMQYEYHVANVVEMEE